MAERVLGSRREGASYPCHCTKDVASAYLGNMWIKNEPQPVSPPHAHNTNTHTHTHTQSPSVITAVGLGYPWPPDSLEKTLMLGKIEGKRRREWQRMRCLDGITDSVDMNLSKLQQVMKDRGALRAATSMGLQRVGHNLATQQQQQRIA